MQIRSASCPLEPWLVDILINLTRNDRRQKQRERTALPEASAPEHDGPLAAAHEAELVDALRGALAGLPSSQLLGRVPPAGTACMGNLPPM